MFLWDDRAVETLKKLRAEGHSGGVIASRLGITRSAVIGKLHRIGMASVRDLRADGQKARRVRAKQIRAAEAKQQKPTPIFVPDMIIERPLPASIVATKSFDDLERDDCKFPVGEVGMPNFGFCGAPQAPGQPYCLRCCQIAFEPPKPRKLLQEAA